MVVMLLNRSPSSMQQSSQLQNMAGLKYVDKATLRYLSVAQQLSLLLQHQSWPDISLQQKSLDPSMSTSSSPAASLCRSQ